MNKRVSAYLRLAVFGLPFFIIPFLGGNHLPLVYGTIDKFWIESIFVFSLLGAILIRYFEKGTGPGRDIRRFLAFFAPFAALSVLSLVWTWSIFNTVSGINVLVWVFASVYLYAALGEDRDIALHAMVMGAFASALCAVVQFKIVLPQLAAAFKSGQYAVLLGEQQGLPISSFIHHNMLGGYFAFLLPLAIYFAIFRRNVVCMAASSVIITGLVLTTSRISLGLALLTVLITVAFTCFKRDVKGILITSVVVIVGLSLSAFLLQDHQPGQGTKSTSVLGEKIRSVPGQLSTVNTRTDIWKTGARAVLAKPWSGYGVGSFEYAFRRYSDGSTYTIAAHSTLLKIAAELGIPGLIGFLIYLVAVVTGLRLARGDTKYLFIALSVAAGFLFGMVDFSFDIPAHVLTFFVLSSTLVFCGSKAASPVDGPAGARGRDPSMPISSNGGKILLLCTVLCVLGSFLFTLRADVAKKSIDNGILFEETGLPNEAYLSYREAIRDMPLSHEGYLRAARVLMKTYAREEAPEKRKLLKALMIEDLNKIKGMRDNDSELFFVIGLYHMMLGNEDQAGYFLRKALSFYPSSAYYTYETAEFYYRKGDGERAADLIRSYKPFAEKCKHSSNPNGLFVYKLTDLESKIVYARGDREGALRIARDNLSDAENRVYLTTSSRAREFIPRDLLIGYLTRRVEDYKEKPKSP